MSAARGLKSSYGRMAGNADSPDEALKARALRYLPVVKNELLRIKMRIPNHIDMDDLHGVAIGGMMRALDRWTESTEDTFGAYLRQRVRGSILDELRRLDVFSRNVRKKARNYDATVQELEHKNHGPVTEEQVRKELGLDQRGFEQLMEELRPISILSLDAPLSGENSSMSLAETIDDPNEDSARDTAESRDTARILRERLGDLPIKQQKMLHLYYFKGLRLSEIALIFGLTESRISQLHTQAIRSLYVSLNKEIVD
jgi:RNA polymerase sigma factor for flagellar operon FliA